MSGKLRHSVAVRQPVETVDDYNEPVITWTEVKTVRASIRPITGREFFASQEVQADVTHRIMMRFDTALAAMTPKWSILFGTREFDIRQVRNIDEKGRWFELLCLERV